MKIILRTLGLGLLLATAAKAGPLVAFPTENHALAEGRPEEYFMYVTRDFEGEKSKPWQGGQYGLVRGPVRVGDRVVYTHLHEGVDIRPMRRDAQGNPLDAAKAAAAGRVVHVSKEAGASNYGRYVVVEHRWDGSLYYTLYAHLTSIAVTPGQSVAQGETLGQMGFTGAGIDRERSHLHFEVCLMLNRNYPLWHDAQFPGNPNKHGLYNGLNLSGVDPARLLIEAERNPELKIQQYIGSLEPTFKIGVKNLPGFDLIRMYPWLVPNGQPANPPAWAVTFSRYGTPLRIEALDQALSEPKALWVKESNERLSELTKGYIVRTSSGLRLTDAGQRFAKLLCWPGSGGMPQ